MPTLTYTDPTSLFAPAEVHVEFNEDLVTVLFGNLKRPTLSFPFPLAVLLVVASEQAVSNDYMPEGWDLTESGAVSETALVKMTDEGVVVELLLAVENEVSVVSAVRRPITTIPFTVVAEILGVE